MTTAKPEIQEPPKMGRPSDYSDDIFAEICERMAGGGTLREICEDDHLPARGTVIRWVRNDDGRRKLYELARQAQADWYADEIVQVSRNRTDDTFTEKDGKRSSNHAAVARDRLIVDSLKFLMGKLHPGRYGDKLTPEAQQSETLAITWQQPERIERVIVAPGSLPGMGIAARIAQLEAELAGLRGEMPEQPPRLLTFDPGPLPSRMDGEIVDRLVSAIKASIPQADQRDPETVLDEATAIIEAALRDHYGTAE
jgi:hypothetical protein